MPAKLKLTYDEWYSRSKDRFETKYMPVPFSGCWLWTDAIDRDGYGITSLGRPFMPKQIRAHRASWFLYRGALPDDPKTLVCHRCDVRCCVNPDHLFLGTNYDNVLDMIQKGRAKKALGENRINSKLKDSQVLQIANDKRTLQEIAKDYGVCFQTISLIKTGAIWSHITSLPRIRGLRRGEDHRSCKITDEQVSDIIKDHRSQTDIARNYGISQGHVSALKRGLVRVND